MSGHPVIRGHFLKTVSYLLHVKEPVMKGHPSCRDTFSLILRCPLKTGFTVVSTTKALCNLPVNIKYRVSQTICPLRTKS